MIDLTTFQKGMNVLFPNLSKLVASKSRLYKLFKKRFNYKGETVLWRPMVDAANGSVTFVDSRTYAAGPTPKEARFGFKRDYVHIKLDNEVLLASQGEGASMSAQEAATEAALTTHALQIKLQLIRDGGNARGQILSGYNTDTITLVNNEDVIFFLPGMWIQASDDAGAAASPAGLRSGGAAVQVGKVNIGAGTVTTATGGNWNAAIGALQDGDYLFRRGDYGSAGAAGFFGLDAWFPTTDPGASDSFGGLNRSIAVDKLSGMRVSVGSNLLKGIFAVLAQMELNKDENNGENVCIMSTTNATQLMDVVQTLGKYEPGGDARFGASAFNIVSPWGRTKVVPETGFSQDQFKIGKAESFQIIARHGDVPHWFNGDGRVWRHLGDSDSIEAYLQSYLCTLCETPNLWATGILT